MLPRDFVITVGTRWATGCWHSPVAATGIWLAGVVMLEVHGEVTGALAVVTMPLEMVVAGADAAGGGVAGGGVAGGGMGGHCGCFESCFDFVR